MRLSWIVLGLAIIHSLSAAGGWLPAPQVAREITSLRQVEFSNFTFVRSDSAEIISLRNGTFDGPNYHSYHLMRVAYGDLTGDGTEEAIVLLRGQNTRTSPTLDELFIYTLKAGKAVLLTDFEGAVRGEYILSVGSTFTFRVDEQVLILNRAVRASDREYAPMHYYTIKYRWDGNRLSEVERSSLQRLPEHLMEIG